MDGIVAVIALAFGIVGFAYVFASVTEGIYGGFEILLTILAFLCIGGFFFIII